MQVCWSSYYKKNQLQVGEKGHLKECLQGQMRFEAVPWTQWNEMAREVVPID